MLLLNLGCGSRVHPDWVNIDHSPRACLRHVPILRRFAPTPLPPNFINHDLRRGIPFSEGQVHAVYSSHLLEHLPLASVPDFLREQRRVLKPGGVVRVVIPDLELAARQYLKALDRIRELGDAAQLEYEWTTILLLDQMVRTSGGGLMREWLIKHRDTEFVSSMQGICRQIAQAGGDNPEGFSLAHIKAMLRRGPLSVSAGEVHRWMYDAVSLQRLIKACGFNSIRPVDPDTSSIPGWTHYYLDRSSDGTLHQPGSIYLEGIK